MEESPAPKLVSGARFISIDCLPTLCQASYSKHKKDYWNPTFEDAMNLIAKLPRVAMI